MQTHSRSNFPQKDSKSAQKKNSLYFSPPTSLPCTTFSLKILATSSACAMAGPVAGSVAERDALALKAVRAWVTAAVRRGASPVGRDVSGSGFGWRWVDGGEKR